MHLSLSDLVKAWAGFRDCNYPETHAILHIAFFPLVSHFLCLLLLCVILSLTNPSIFLHISFMILNLFEYMSRLSSDLVKQSSFTTVPLVILRMKAETDKAKLISERDERRSQRLRRDSRSGQHV